MDKKLAGLLGAVAALGAMHTAQAAASPTDVLQVNSFAELLEPIPNAAAQLKALDEHQASQPAEAKVELAQYYVPYYHHHHHHHHHHHAFYPRSYGYEPEVVIVPRYRRYYHHHHHHHHHHSFYRRDYY
jgi:hypothetical protein